MGSLSFLYIWQSVPFFSLTSLCQCIGAVSSIYELIRLEFDLSFSAEHPCFVFQCNCLDFRSCQSQRSSPYSSLWFYILCLRHFIKTVNSSGLLFPWSLLLYQYYIALVTLYEVWWYTSIKPFVTAADNFTSTTYRSQVICTYYLSFTVKVKEWI